MVIDIPHFKRFDIRHIVFDYNGTVAKDGQLLDGLSGLFHELAELYTVHVVTADTFGSVAKELEGVDVRLKILASSEHTNEKKDFVESIGAEQCIAIGNGNNDALMLERSGIGIAIVGDEGCSTTALMKSDLVCRNIVEAMELCLHPKRLIASLRR